MLGILSFAVTVTVAVITVTIAITAVIASTRNAGFTATTILACWLYP